MLPRSLNDAIQRDQIRDVEVANRDPASVGLLQYFE
jgi:hypothetical protein